MGIWDILNAIQDGAFITKVLRFHTELRGPQRFRHEEYNSKV